MKWFKSVDLMTMRDTVFFPSYTLPVFKQTSELFTL